MFDILAYACMAFAGVVAVYIGLTIWANRAASRGENPFE